MVISAKGEKKDFYLEIKEFAVSPIDDMRGGVRVCDIDEVCLQKKTNKEDSLTTKSHTSGIYSAFRRYSYPLIYSTFWCVSLNSK
jgi:hypothetical protein